MWFICRSTHEEGLFPLNALNRVHTWIYAWESSMAIDIGPGKLIRPRLCRDCNGATAVNGCPARVMWNMFSQLWKANSFMKNRVNICNNTKVQTKELL